MKTRLITQFFSSDPNWLGTSLFHLEMIKIHFDGATIWSILVCKTPDFGGESFEIRILSRSI